MATKRRAKIKASAKTKPNADAKAKVSAGSEANTRNTATTKPTAKPHVEFVKTPRLKVAYHAWGDPGGKPAVLVHGFPDDAQGWRAVAEDLAGRGYYALAPYLRGYGETRFLSEKAPRTAQQSELANDLKEFLEAMAIPRAAVIGHDWGARVAAGLAALHPERVSSLTVLNGYLLYNFLANQEPGLPIRESPAWYQWYFNTERGARGLERYRREIGRLLWTQWSPSWKFSVEEFESVADSWENPDFVKIVVHSYRHRYGNAPTNQEFAEDELVLQTLPQVPVPSVVLFGEEDPMEPPEDWEKQKQRWPEDTRHLVVANAGHFMQHEQPEIVVAEFVRLQERVGAKKKVAGAR
ncbi:MAG: alpha/beta hydrolase [Candidatus Acidiferrales bacterium]